MPRTRGGTPLPDSQAQRSRRLLDARQMDRVMRRMAGEIIERNHGAADLILVGIRTRGVPLAEALADEIGRLENVEVPRGILDITLYRDDLSVIGPQPIVRPTSLQEPIDDKVVVLCDDVLFTGRTVRAALDALIDYGRPKAVRLAVLVDRGHRELPIQADFIGKTVETLDDDVVKVAFEATDGRQEVMLLHEYRAPRDGLHPYPPDPLPLKGQGAPPPGPRAIGGLCWLRSAGSARTCSGSPSCRGGRSSWCSTPPSRSPRWRRGRSRRCRRCAARRCSTSSSRRRRARARASRSPRSGSPPTTSTSL